jgi:thioredoxin-like negative regulator of GroEL
MYIYTYPHKCTTLGVSGLPTVFAVNNGKVSDRFIGMLPQDDLQQVYMHMYINYSCIYVYKYIYTYINM